MFLQAVEILLVLLGVIVLVTGCSDATRCSRCTELHAVNGWRSED
jgi:hypothetical protein